MDIFCYRRYLQIVHVVRVSHRRLRLITHPGTHFRFSKQTRTQVLSEWVRTLNKARTMSRSFIVFVAFLSPNCTTWPPCHVTSVAPKINRRKDGIIDEENQRNTKRRKCLLLWIFNYVIGSEIWPTATLILGKCSRLHATPVTGWEIEPKK